MKNNKTPASAEKRMERRALSSGGRMLGLTVLALVLVIAVNLLAALLPADVRLIPLANADLYEPDETLISYVRDLPDGDPIQLYFVAEAGSEELQIQLFAKSVAALNSRITLETIDPAIHPERISALTKDNVSSNSLIAVMGDRVQVLQNSSLITYSSTADSSGASRVSSIVFHGNDMLLTALKYLLSDELPTVYLLTGHGEKSLPESYATALSRENITAVSLSLLVTKSVPDDAGCVMILNPDTDISSEEYDMLLAYLEKGGRLLFLSDYLPGTAHPANLSRLMAYYGMQPGDLVMETDTSYYYYYPYSLLPDLCEHDITKSLGTDLVMLSYTHAIAETDLHRDTVTVKPLLDSSASSYTVKVEADGKIGSEDSATGTGIFHLGAVAEEKFDDITTRIVWYGSGSLIDESTNTIVSGHNSDLFINTVAYLCDFESAMDNHSKVVTINYLVMTEQQRTVLSVALIGLVPLTALVAGLAVYLRRRSR